ncbi:hypothetical protein Tco_1469601 [Tanacetum coccineum]
MKLNEDQTVVAAMNVLVPKIEREAGFGSKRDTSHKKHPNKKTKNLSVTFDDVKGVDDVKAKFLEETDIRQKDKKSSKNGQNQAQNGKAWKKQS